jgi:hypothetical protein
MPQCRLRQKFGPDQFSCKARLVFDPGFVEEINGHIRSGDSGEVSHGTIDDACLTVPYIECNPAKETTSRGWRPR